MQSESIFLEKINQLRALNLLFSGIKYQTIERKRPRVTTLYGERVGHFISLYFSRLLNEFSNRYMTIMIGLRKIRSKREMFSNLKLKR